MQVHKFEVDRGDRTTGLPIDEVYDQCRPLSSYLYDVVRYEREATKAALKGKPHPLVKEGVNSDIVNVHRNRLAYDESLLSENSLYEKVYCYMVLDGTKYVGHLLLYEYDGLHVRDMYMSFKGADFTNEQCAAVVRSLVLKVIEDSMGQYGIGLDISNSLISTIINTVHQQTYGSDESE